MKKELYKETGYPGIKRLKNILMAFEFFRVEIESNSKKLVYFRVLSDGMLQGVLV